MVDAYRGASTIANRQTDEVEESYRRMVLELDPNGKVPITGLLSRMPTETTDSVTHNWWERKRSPRSGTAAVYIDSNLATTYSYSSHLANYGAVGDTVYAKVAAALAAEFRKGHTVRLLDASNMAVSVGGTVNDVNVNGANSRIEIILDEADDNASTPSATASLQTVDNIEITGSVHAENAEGPLATNYKPTKRTNYCQTFREAVQMSRRDMVQKIRTDQGYEKLRFHKLQKHLENLEHSLIWGIPRDSTNVDENGNAMTRMAGLIYWINTYATTAANNVVNFTTDRDYSGDTFRESGMDWLNKVLSVLSIYGSAERHGYCGYLVNLAVNDLAQTYQNINVTQGKNNFGQVVSWWEISGLRIEMRQHAMMSTSPDMQRAMIIIDPANVRQVVFRGGETHYKTDPNTRAMLKALKKGTAGQIDIDGIREEWLGDYSMEIHHPDTHMIADGFGMTNTV